MPAPALPPLMTHAEWLKGTSLALRTRSKELKAIDAELLHYERTPSAMRLARVQEKFEAWKKSKGADDAWKGS